MYTENMPMDTVVETISIQSRIEMAFVEIKYTLFYITHNDNGIYFMTIWHLVIMRVLWCLLQIILGTWATPF